MQSLLKANTYKIEYVFKYFYTTKMTSYLFDKLNILKANEEKIKEEQRMVQEKIALEIETQRRLELDSTIVKLQTQLGEFSKNIDGEIMPNNHKLVCNQYDKDYRDQFRNVRLRQPSGKLEQNTEKHLRNLKAKAEKARNEMHTISSSQIAIASGSPPKITLKTFLENVNELDDDMKKRVENCDSDYSQKKLITIPHEIKIYNDILPIFTTLIGILKKQEDEINKLKKIKQ